MGDLVRGFPVNQPRRGRLGSRYTRIIIPAPVVTGAAVGRIRLRSKTAEATANSGDFDAGVVVGQSGTIYVAPVGTAAPTSATSALNSAFVRLGFMSEEGITIREEKNLEPRSSWTSFYPDSFYILNRRTLVSFSLREFTQRTLEFALEGAVSGTAPGPYTYATESTDIVTKALVIDWQDGVRRFRIYIPKGSVDTASSMNIARTRPTDIPVVFSVHQHDTNPYTWFISLV